MGRIRVKLLVLCLLIIGFTSASLALPLKESYSLIVKKAFPSVVNIFTEQRVNMPQDIVNFYANILKVPPEKLRKRTSLGSGVIISKDGYVVTNYHVVERAVSIKVALFDGSVYNAKVVGYDKNSDIAVIKILANRSFTPATLGNSDKTEIGDIVLAIGNPFGLSYTVTAGVISGKGRIIGEDYFDQFIQTDASINPGNSGGPLINTKGEVIGINTAMLTNAQGIGFAIPINTVKFIVRQITSGKAVTRGWFGAEAVNLNPQIATQKNLKVKRGALITSVIKDSPAYRAGIREGDIIVEYDGKPVTDASKLPIMVGETSPGTKVKVRVLRNGKFLDFVVTIGKSRRKT